MSKILSDEDGDTIWNDPTPNIDEPEIEQAIDKHCQPNHQEIGRVAVETPPIYFTSPNRASPDDFGWCDMGTYLTKDD